VYELALQHAADGAIEMAVTELRQLLDEPLLARDSCACMMYQMQITVCTFKE